MMQRAAILAVSGFLSGQMLHGQITGAVLSVERPLSALEIAQAEATVRVNPADLITRIRLLRGYKTMGGAGSAGTRFAFQTDRVNHILYLIDNVPSDPVGSSELTYVPSAKGPFADASDHEAVRNAWGRAVNRVFGSAPVLLNAARFLYREHPDEAEQLLSQASDREPGNQSLAANLGFFYAMDILEINGPTQAEREQARQKLDHTVNVFVLAGAATALPNLFPRTELARTPNAGSEIFALAAALIKRARELAPQQKELAGPMPLIQEFQAFLQAGAAQFSAPAVTFPRAERLPSLPVASAVQALKLVQKAEAIYPPEAIQAGIQGSVGFDAIINANGNVESLTLRMGHPLLVSAALEAATRYKYQPTLLNGERVRVRTQVEVAFTLPR